MDDIALINTSRTPVQMDAIRRQFNPRIIFLWGIRICLRPDILQKFPDMSHFNLGKYIHTSRYTGKSMSSDLPGRAVN